MDHTTPDRPKRVGGLSRRGATIALVIGLTTGGFAGGYLVSQAASPSPSPSGSAGTTTPSAPGTGTFKTNEDPTHESGESAAREAQENTGQRPTVP